MILYYCIASTCPDIFGKFEMQINGNNCYQDTLIECFNFGIKLSVSLLFSFRCLAENGWDYERAVRAFGVVNVSRLYILPLCNNNSHSVVFIESRLHPS